jgi:GT2 family glycosyltransferase
MYRLATTQNFSAVTGACLMVKKSLYDALGGLDEANFAVAYNDIDFCLRLRAKGLLNVMTPFAAAIHYESKSRGDDTHSGGEKQARYEGERARFINKYEKIIKQGDPYYNPHLTLLYENYGLK